MTGETPEAQLQKITSYAAPERALLDKALADFRPAGHALGVASILIDLGMDSDAIAASLINFSGAGFEPERIEKEYNKNIASLVQGARKVAHISAKSKAVAEAENIRKMLFAMIDDIRVLFIKLADRLQTLRSLKQESAEEKKHVAQECLDIYAPLADRFGVSWLKDELEDLSLKYLNNEAFLQIKEIVAFKKAERQNFLDTIQLVIRQEAENAGIPIDVHSRAKHFYSIYQKMRKRNKSANEIYDLFGIRILCETVESCYTLLGLVHRVWKPLEGRFKDYIAMPKANGYQSLHTTVMTGIESGGASNHIEVQIRTYEMHNIAEHGIASHWLYKKGSTTELVTPGYLPVVNKMKSFLAGADAAEHVAADDGDMGSASALASSSSAFLAAIKKELLQDSIFVFTPQGKVIELPKGATALDFAYCIHSAVGEHCSLAKADGKIISLSTPLENTQVIEITTSQAAHPHNNWLSIVKTSRARNRIRQWLSANDETIIAERNLLEKKKKAAAEARAEFLAHTAAGAPKHEQKTPPPAGGGFEPVRVRVENEKNMLVRFAKCCNPAQGDEIVGFVSRGRGIIIHRKDCKSIPYIKDFEQRRISTEWDYGGAKQ